MTRYEWFRWLTFPLMPVHLQTVRRDIQRLVQAQRKRGEGLEVLDVGGRKSPYTIGLPAHITLLDVPQEAGTSQELNLGFTPDILTTLQQKRSNIRDLVVQDMTRSTLPEAVYDGVVCVEVIEHVAEDEAFVRHIARVLTPGGFAYFTTPNGDYIKNEGPDKNPDHIRHYTREELQGLLERYFDEVTVHYAVATGKFRVWSLCRFRINQPLRLLKTLVGVAVNRIQSRQVQQRKDRTAHLIAVARKKAGHETQTL